MKSIFSRIIICLLFCLFRGCSEDKPDNPVELTLYLIGTEPEHHIEFNKEVNKLLLRDFDARLSIKYIDWTNWITEYRLVLQTNKAFDMIYTSSWAGYYEYAAQGIFMPLDEYLPDDLEGMGWLDREDVRSIVSVNGKIYAIPANQRRYELFGILYRKDLDPRKGDHPVVSVETQEAYLAAVKSAHDIVPLNVGVQDALVLASSYLFFHDYAYRYDVGGSFVWRERNGKKEISGFSFAEGIEDIFLLFRKWRKLGYLPLNSLQKNTNSADSLIAGESAMTNTMHIHDAYQYANQILSEHPDWDLGFWEWSAPGTAGYYSTPLQDAVAISAHSRHPELAIKIIQAIKTRPEYNKLFFMGLPGIHYAAEETGTGNDGSAKKYVSWNMSNWAFRNEPEFSYVKNLWKEWDILEKKRSMTFSYNTERFKPVNLDGLLETRQRLIDIQLAGLPPLELGLAPDPLKQLESVRKQMLDNGYREFIDTLNSQIN